MEGSKAKKVAINTDSVVKDARRCDGWLGRLKCYCCCAFFDGTLVTVYRGYKRPDLYTWLIFCVEKGLETFRCCSRGNILDTKGP